jgi:hypothetical protein
MIASVRWFAPAQAQVVISDKTRTHRGGSLPDVVYCQAASPATSCIHRGHREMSKIKA